MRQSIRGLFVGFLVLGALLAAGVVSSSTSPSVQEAPQAAVPDSILAKFAEEGIGPGKVRLKFNYGKRGAGQSPYMRTYVDDGTGTHVAEITGLPMVDADGVPIEVGWRLAGVNYFAEKNNLFRAKIQGTSVELTVRNDQPDTRKANDKLTFNPTITLNGLPLTTGASTLLAVDPLNANYLGNTLEWNYGVVIRRLRIIEGMVQGSWVFSANPGGDVRIKYNQVGTYRLKLGQYRVNDDEEFIASSVFAQAPYPFVVSDSATYYPDADEETTSVDGIVWRELENPGETWAAIIAGAGTHSEASQFVLEPTYILAATTSNQFRWNFRSIILFDTSALPDMASISAATLSLNANSKGDGLSATPNANIYGSTPASNTALAASDYGQTQSVAFATAISYADWTPDVYNDFPFNSNGIAAISKTGVSKFSAKNANYDVAGVQPNWVSGANSNLIAYPAEQGAGKKPKLVVTYTVRSGFFAFMW